MSHLIVFDMEWNMGYRPGTFRYHGAQQVLRGEIIQIGAVKMDGQEIRDTFRMILRPHIFKKLHHHVARVTGLTQKEINEGVPAGEGLQRFRRWCGRDAVLGEWGMDDVPVLKQNLFLNGLDENWPEKWYDLQKVFTAQNPLGEGEGLALESVVDRLGIEKNMDFHDALADAMYTAKVLQHVDIEKGLAACPDEEQQLRELLCPEDKQRFDFISWKGFTDGDAWKKNEQMRTACCPVCGRVLIPDADDVWLERGSNSLHSLAFCEQHGPVMVRMRRSHADGLHYMFARAVEQADEEACVKWQNDKKAALERARRRLEKENSRKNG